MIKKRERERIITIVHCGGNYFCSMSELPARMMIASAGIF